ncbi:hypothetical protein ATO6_05820 [Oceanicola sp. 22II-s10i]|uniref:alpha/beta fold hydrolase n=1 Tax=Oceanicola sp. 22II-s10i TaxID=1317116 RepID=UPI000B528347|nr:alpha/beta hydrolase [Oceanicola sp. 22II-s10i]OWU86339.1 hypothetical protein ATO6_05820 [Oceanicola sp. 22II-s10i]
MFARLFRLIPILMLVATAACSLLPTPQEIDVMPLVHDGKAKKGIKRAVVVIPGAMATVGIYEPVLDWNVPDGAILAYRFPGLDGLKLDHRLDIAAAGQLIADAMDRLEVEEVMLVGFSTGGPVALEAANRVKAPEVKVALISSAGSFPSGVQASVEGFFDVLKALIRAHGSTAEDLWLENYRNLLYGREHFAEKGRADESKKLAEMQRGHLQRPETRLTLAHTSSLMTWELPRAEGLKRAHIGIFHGEKDTVFPLDQARRFARRLHAEQMAVYPGQGHILFVTAPTLWEDIRKFFGLPPAGKR